MQYDLFGNVVQVAQSTRCSIREDGGGLVINTPYSPSFVEQLKAQVPATDRRWDAGNKAWVVAARHGQTVQQIILNCFREQVIVPVIHTAQVRQTRICEVRYLGGVKDRAGEHTALGLDAQGTWSFVFPESALRDFFGEAARPGSTGGSLYGTLGIKRTASQDDIKSAYRMMARQWHPDVCKEPDANQVFMRIQEAYQILSNENMRARYNAGLALEASLGSNKPNPSDLYRAPVRCGMVMCEGVENIGRFTVEKIHAWQEIARADGKILVVSWPYGADRPLEMWV